MRGGIVRGVLIVAGAAALLAGGDPVRADSAASRNNEGNRLYEEARYDEALKHYSDAQALHPEAPELHYNIGNVLFRKGEFDKAAEEYLRAQAAPDGVLSQAATFNRGNALMFQGRLQEAINAYVQALRADPADLDAKRNLELALRLLEQQEQQQKDKRPQEGDPPDEDDRPKEEPPPEGGDKEPREQPPQPQRRPGEMSKEEVRQILEALREEEKEGIRKHARATAGDSRTPEKDW